MKGNNENMFNDPDNDNEMSIFLMIPLSIEFILFKLTGVIYKTFF